MRVAENNGTGGAMMRMSRPQPVSLDKGLCRTGIRSRTAENDTLPYPCDAGIRHRMSEDLERSGYISHMLGKEISSRGESMEMYVDHQLHLVSIWLPNDEKDVGTGLQTVQGHEISGCCFQIRKREFAEQYCKAAEDQ